jgi:hypothetical protein
MKITTRMTQMRSSATSGLARTIQRSPSSVIRAGSGTPPGTATWRAGAAAGVVTAAGAPAPCRKSTLMSGEIIPSETKFVTAKSAMQASATPRRPR